MSLNHKIQGCNGGNFIETESGVGIFRFDFTELEAVAGRKSW